MKFLDLDRNEIRRNGCLEGQHYVYTVGSPIEVTAVRSLHKNELLARKLSTCVKDDRMMTKYRPTNKVYFSRGVVDNENGGDFVSCCVDDKNCRIYIGSVGEYGNVSGILTFSGYLSLNNQVEENKSVLCTDKMIATVMSHVRILSLGLVEDNVLGLFYIPGVKGIKVAERGSCDLGVSPVTYKTSSASGYKSFTIESWFDGLTRIKEV